MVVLGQQLNGNDGDGGVVRKKIEVALGTRIEWWREEEGRAVELRWSGGGHKKREGRKRTPPPTPTIDQVVATVTEWWRRRNHRWRCGGRVVKVACGDSDGGDGRAVLRSGPRFLVIFGEHQIVTLGRSRGEC